MSVPLPRRTSRDRLLSAAATSLEELRTQRDALADALEALLAAPDMPKALDALNAERVAREHARAALRAAGRLP